MRLSVNDVTYFKDYVTFICLKMLNFILLQESITILI